MRFVTLVAAVSALVCAESARAELIYSYNPIPDQNPGLSVSFNLVLADNFSSAYGSYYCLYSSGALCRLNGISVPDLKSAGVLALEMRVAGATPNFYHEGTLDWLVSLRRSTDGLHGEIYYRGSDATENVYFSLNGTTASYSMLADGPFIPCNRYSVGCTGTYQITTAVPEPMAMSIFGFGLAGLLTVLGIQRQIRDRAEVEEEKEGALFG